MFDFFKTKIAIWQKDIVLKSIPFFLKIINSFPKQQQKWRATPYHYKSIDPLEAFPHLQVTSDNSKRDYKRLYKILNHCKKFTLIGGNWLDKEDVKPIAMFWGFNEWKRGFTSDYFPEYRTVFAPRKYLQMRSLYGIYKFPERPSVFIVWGYTESLWIKCASKLFKIPLYRLEDGFVRSAHLGATHATPYSLILDKKGLYYNGYQESDLEHLLNHYDFESDISLLKNAEKSLENLIENKISKYNPPYSGKSSKPLIKLKNRILVVGQVDNDASLRYGNPHRWTMEDVVKLAKYENPLAEIFYRPHPEVYNGFQKSKFRRNRVKDFATIIPPNTPLPELLEDIDHVYVITSLAGMEALLRDIPVTVFGTPFYAGWGLTDDRVPLKRRKRKLTKLELFAVSYLKYPRYLADLKNSEVGLGSATLRIMGERELFISIAQEKQVEQLIGFSNKNEIEKKIIIQNLKDEKLWQVLIGLKDKEDKEEILGRVTDVIPALVKESNHYYFQMAVVYTLLGLLKNSKHIDDILAKTIDYIHPDIITNLLQDLVKKFHDDETMIAYSRYLSGIQEHNIAKNVLGDVVKNYEWFDEKNPYQEEKELSNNYKINDSEAGRLLKIAKLYIDSRELEKALEILKYISLSGYGTSETLLLFADIARLRFDFSSCVKIAFFCNKIDSYSKNYLPYRLIGSHFSLTDFHECDKHFYIHQKHIIEMIKLTLIYSYAVEVFNYITTIVDFPPELTQFYYQSIYLDSQISVQKMQAYIGIGEYEKAIDIGVNILLDDAPQNHRKAMLLLTEAYRCLQKMTDALDIAKKCVEVYDDEMAYKELLKTFSYFNQYQEAQEYRTEALYRNINLGNIIDFTTELGNRQIGEAYRSFLSDKFRDVFISYFPEKYWNLDKELSSKNIDNLLVLATYGPGDEIRYISIYYDIIEEFKDKTIKFTCDYRVLPLLQRQFPNNEFVPLHRTRAYGKDYPVELFNRLPGSDIHAVLDNHGLDAVNEADNIIFVTDLIWRYRKDYPDFPRKPFLTADNQKIKALKARMPKKDTLLVGLSWRSFYLRRTRNEHYFTIEDLEPLFQIEGIQFINMQYDDCTEELAIIEQKYPGKMLDFEDVDKFNDFDTFAALMCCTDVNVAPATNVMELSGALGCKTLFLLNSPEGYWRKYDDTETDVWHESVKIIAGDILNNQTSTIEKLCDELKKMVQEKTNQHILLVG